MGKKEDALKQLEHVLNELKKGESESAATVAAGRGNANVGIPRTIWKLFFKFWGGKVVFIVLLLIAAAFAGAWVLSGSTFKKESTVSVEQIQELATLATAEAHVTVTLEQQDNKLFGNEISVNFPGTKREILLIVPATVLAGVDLQGVTSEDVKIDEKKKELEITLPHAAFIQHPTIQMDRVQTFSDEGLFRGEVKWEEGFDLAAEAQEEIKAKAVELGLLATAEASAEKVLKNFFGHLGYTVRLTFR